MSDRPPNIDYMAPPPPRRSWSRGLLWWMPSLIACLISLAILLAYGDLASIPRGLYKVQQCLLIGAFWWVPLAFAIRAVLWIRYWW